MRSRSRSISSRRDRDTYASVNMAENSADTAMRNDVRCHNSGRTATGRSVSGPHALVPDTRD